MRSKIDISNINEQAAKDILSLDYVLLYFQHRLPQYEVKSVVPASFTIGTSHNNEGLETSKSFQNTFWFGKLQLDVNPRGVEFQAENITMIIRSMYNGAPFNRRLNRIIEVQNYLNEQTERTELFSEISITNTSTAYDTYLSFIGFEIQVG